MNSEKYLKKYLKYKNKYLELKGGLGEPQDHPHCTNIWYSRPNPIFKRNTYCNIANGGYVLDTLQNYMTFQKFTNTELVMGINCLKLYRGEPSAKHSQNPKTTVNLYNERMDKYFKQGINNAIGWSNDRPPNYLKSFGQEPSIGINTTTNLDMALIYGTGYELSLNPGGDKCTIFTFYIDINNSNILKVNSLCQWAQITCDKIANEKYDLIGYTNVSDDINILDQGRNKIVKIESDLYNIANQKKIPGTTITW